MTAETDRDSLANSPGAPMGEGHGAPQGMPLPLTGVRVLDLGHVFQGPYATFLMAMAGADVIKVEPLHGEMSRRRGRDGDYPFRALNGCKRGIVLNLKTGARPGATDRAQPQSGRAGGKLCAFGHAAARPRTRCPAEGESKADLRLGLGLRP